MMSFSKKSATKWLLNSALAFTLAVSLAGCSGADEETPELQKTSDASLTETADYVPASPNGPAQNVPQPRISAVVTEKSQQGAIAALEYFWEAEAFASLTGDTGPLTAVSADNCAFCFESIEGWPDNYEAGYWSVLHGDIEVEVTKVDISQDQEKSGDIAHVFFRLTEPPTDFYDQEGKHLAGSFETTDTQEWFGVLRFDTTAEMWRIEWLGLENDVVWEE